MDDLLEPKTAIERLSPDMNEVADAVNAILEMSGVNQKKEDSPTGEATPAA